MRRSRSFAVYKTSTREARGHDEPDLQRLLHWPLGVSSWPSTPAMRRGVPFSGRLSTRNT